MFSSARRRFRAYGRSSRGNVAIIFALSIIPILLLMGGGIDLARHSDYHGRLANATDAAALALARQGAGLSDAEMIDFIRDRISAMDVGADPDRLVVKGYWVVRTKNGYVVNVDAEVKTTFLAIASLTGYDLSSLNAGVHVEVVSSSNRVELALVLDNTGSMDQRDTGKGTRMDGVKAAAKSLVETLMKPGLEDPDFIKIALVPFEGSVNIQNAAFKWDWIDKGSYESGTGRWYGRARYNGINFDKLNNKPVSHFWLHEQLRKAIGVDWAGCVEARAEPHDLLDTPPSQGNPDTLFVQAFWPDEPDGGGMSASAQQHDGYWNNYLKDQSTATSDLARQKSLAKYQTVSAWRKATARPIMSGPNRGCPQPIVPLTTDKAGLLAAINTMVPTPAMGTFIPTGLVWGWHVVSPGEPFTEGVAQGQKHFEDTVKAVVLLTDGENSSTADGRTINQSTYSAYNYVSNGRLGSYRNANATLDTKTATLCGNVKADGVRVYTITFGNIAEATKTLMRNCASVDKGQQLYYHAPSDADLADAFAAIGDDLAEIRIAR